MNSLQEQLKCACPSCGSLKDNGRTFRVSIERGFCSECGFILEQTNNEIPIEKHKKLIVAMRYWLLGKEYFVALDSMEFGLKFHTGTRKDKKTPEFHHQVLIAHYMRTLSRNLMYPEETIATTFLHDIPEDYDVTIQELAKRFGDRIAHSTRLLTRHGKDNDALTGYYEEMAEDPIASIGKPGDRINNIQTMIGVFSQEGQEWYVEETEKYILPMIKKAKRNFPRQEPAYENAKHILISQVELIRALHQAKRTT